MDCLCNTSYGSLQVHRSLHPFSLQPQTRGPATDCPAFRHMDPGLGRGLPRDVRNQQHPQPGPQRMQAGGQQLRGVFLRLFVFRAVPHHAFAVLRDVPGPEELGGGEEGQAEEQHAGQQKASGGHRVPAAAVRPAAASAARDRERPDWHYLRGAGPRSLLRS